MGPRICWILFASMLVCGSLATRVVDQEGIFFGKRSSSSLVGGWSRADSRDPTVISAAKFAVEEHNKEQKLTGNQKLMYSKVVDARKQVVQGVMYEITVEATSKRQSSQYEARVWVKEWENYQKLMDFKRV